jgi:hypothetical protein
MTNNDPNVSALKVLTGFLSIMLVVALWDESDGMAIARGVFWVIQHPALSALGVAVVALTSALVAALQPQP